MTSLSLRGGGGGGGGGGTPCALCIMRLYWPLVWLQYAVVETESASPGIQFC